MLGLGGQLAAVHSPQEHTFVSDLRPNTMPVWLGGSDFAEEKKLVWTDGITFGYTNWLPGEPNDPKDRLELGHRWNDSTCTRLY